MRPPRIWIWCRFSAAAFSVSVPVQRGPAIQCSSEEMYYLLLWSAIPRSEAEMRRHQTEANWWYDSNIRLCLMYDQRRTRIWIFSTHWGMMNSQETGAHICTAVSVLSRGRKLLSLCPLNRVSCRAVNKISRIYYSAHWRPQQAVWSAKIHKAAWQW